MLLSILLCAAPGCRLGDLPVSLVSSGSPLKNDPSFTFFFFFSWTFPRYVVSIILQKFLTDNDSRKYPSEKKKKVNDGSFFRRLSGGGGDDE